MHNYKLRSRVSASEFLDLMTWGQPVTFQTFDDRGSRPYLAQILHGTFRETWRELARLNQYGAGIFWTVNRTDLLGRSSRNIIGLRALFTDDDGGGKRRFKRLCPPTAIVYSAGGPHCYWRLVGGEDLSAFRCAQKALISYFQTDNKIHDLPRVMRLPGFWHCKNRPELVRWAPVAVGRSYRISDITGAYPPPRAQERPQRRQYESYDSRWKPWSKPITEGGRNYQINAMGYHMLREGVSFHDVEREVWRVNASLCDPPMEDWEIIKILNNLRGVR